MATDVDAIERRLDDLVVGDLGKVVTFPREFNEAAGVLLEMRVGVAGNGWTAQVWLLLGQPANVPASERGRYLRGPWPPSTTVQLTDDPDTQ